jgi:glycosyltransferase involved in cell wall biosynthesis
MNAGLDHAGVTTAPETPEVIWVYRRSRRQWLDEWRRGDRSGEFFYSMPTLGRRYRVGFVEDERRHPFLRAWWPMEWILARRFGMGFALDLVLRNVGVLRRARVVVSTVDSCGLPLALLKNLGLLRARLIYISQGLSDRVAAYGARRWLSRRYRNLLLGVDELVVLSGGARDSLATWLGVPADRIRVLPFGTDCEFWRNTALSGERGGRVISVGSDSGRDYPTLLAAAADLPLHIVTRQPLTLDRHPNLIHSTNHSPIELRDIYSRAAFVVIPLLDRSQPSGQSATLQAMACGKAVIVTRTRGWWGEPFVRDGETCVLVPPGDVSALRAAMRRFWSEPELCRRIGQKARETVVSHFSEDQMAAALDRLIGAHVC